MAEARLWLFSGSQKSLPYLFSSKNRMYGHDGLLLGHTDF